MLEIVVAELLPFQRSQIRVWDRAPPSPDLDLRVGLPSAWP